MRITKLMIISISTMLLSSGLTAATKAISNTVDKNGNDKIIKSTNSTLCYIQTSKNRGNIKAETDSSNVYDTLKECLEDGGKLSKSMINALGSESPEFLVEKIADMQVGEERKKKKKEEKEETTQFLGLNWNLGIGLTSLGGGEVIDNVSIETLITSGTTTTTNTINVDTASEYSVELMLEFHKYLEQNNFDSGVTIGYGPFVAIGLAGEGKEPLDTFALGLMLGGRIRGEESSFNIGVGWYLDSQVTRLKSGLTDGMETTITDPSKLINTRDDTGWMIMFSATF